MFSCDNVKTLVSFLCTEFNLSEAEAYNRILEKNPELLPQKMIKELAGSTKKAPKIKVWASKKAEELAKEYGYGPDDILTKSGKDSTITLPDVKMTYKMNGLKIKPTPKVEVEPEPEDDEDEEELELEDE